MARTMKDSGIEWIGMIPETWSIKKVKHCFVRKNEKAEQENPIILSLARSGVKVRDVSTGEGQIAESYYNYNPVCVGDLLLNPMDLYSGANCSVSKVEGVISPAYINLRAKDNNNSSYYDYFFKTQYWGMTLFAHGKGVSFDNRWTLNAETLFNYFLPVPSVSEQQKIAKFLDEKIGAIDELIIRTKESIEEYKRYKQSVITEVITLGLDKAVVYKETNIDYVKKIPAHWDVLKLRFLGSCQNGISKSSEAFGSGYPFVSYGDVYRNYELPEVVVGQVESTESERENYSVKYGDVFFTRTSETIEEVGFTSTCLKTIENAVFAGFVIRFRTFNNEKLSPRFSKYYFRSDIHRRFFVKEMNLVTRASLSQELLKKLPVLLPPLEEQEEIADYLDVKCGEIDALIAKKEAFVEEMEAYKKSLIYEYVTGKKEVL